MESIQTGERMKLLNLWPRTQDIAHPKKRLLLEMLLALLAVVALVLCMGLWLNWRLLNVRAANQTLKTEWVQLNQSRTVEISSGAEMPRMMRQLLVGQLDWMGELPQWLMDERVRWVSAKYDDKGLQLVGVALNGEAINAMLETIASRYPNPPVRIHQIANVNISGQTLWRFEMNIDAQTLRNKVELTADADPSLGQSDATDKHTDSAQPQSQVNTSVGGAHE